MASRGMAAKQPERFIDRFLLLQAVLLLIIQTVSAGMLVWSTVVLLRGFVSVLLYEDFCYISIISIDQMLRVYNVLVDEQYIFFCNALFKPLTRCARWVRRIWTTDTKLQPFPKYSTFNVKTILYLMMDSILLIVLIFVVLHPLLVLYFCVLLSLSRLRNGNFGDPSVPNLDMSCRAFYILALSQGTIYIIWYLLNFSSVGLKRLVASKCGFNPSWGLEAVNQYFTYTQSMCLKDLLLTKEWNMIKFGIRLLDSEDAEILLGARLTVSFIEKGTVLVQNLQSPKTVQKLLTVLAWKKRDCTDMELRMLTLKILAHVSEDLCVAQYPGFLERLTSLFELSGEGECKLMQQGLLILEGLSRDKLNCNAINSNSLLLNHIIEVMFYSTNNSSDWMKIQYAASVHQVIAAEVYRNICFHCVINCSEGIVEKVIQLLLASANTQHGDHLQTEVHVDPQGEITEVQVNPQGEIQHDVKRLQAALLSAIATLYSNGTIKGVFARVVDQNASSFMGILKQMVERNYRDMGYGMQLVKASAIIVRSVLQYDPQEESEMCLHKKVLKQIKEEQIVETLCLVSGNTRSIENSEHVFKKTFWKIPMCDLVTECKNASARRR